MVLRNFNQLSDLIMLSLSRENSVFFIPCSFLCQSGCMDLSAKYPMLYQTPCVAKQEMLSRVCVAHLCLKFVLENTHTGNTRLLAWFYMFILQCTSFSLKHVNVLFLLFEINTEVFNLFQSVNYLSKS